MYFSFLKNKVPKLVLALNIILAIFYFVIIAFYFKRGNPILFSLLIAGEVFHLYQALTFIATVWETGHSAQRSNFHKPGVDVFIPVAGEPIEIIEKTVQAGLIMNYPKFEIYILNDSFVT